MTDIVVRLTQTSAHTLTPQETVYLLHESRDEIDRLRKEVKGLKAMFLSPGKPGDHSRLLSDASRPHYVPQAEIDTAHPLVNGSHATYGAAMVLVGERHAKADLADLVNFLLQRASRAEAKVEEMAKALRELDEMIFTDSQVIASAGRFRDHIRAALAQGIVTQRDETRSGSGERSEVEPGRPAADAPKHVWAGPGPEPESWYAPDGAKVYRSYEDYCDG